VRIDRGLRLGLKALAFATGLTIFLAFDDWLLLALVRELGLGVASDSALLALGALLTATNAGLAVAVLRLIRKRPVTGSEGLIGQVGTALHSFRDVGQVAVHGEIWRARTQSPVAKGQKVYVLSLRGLELDVRPLKSARSDVVCKGSPRPDPVSDGAREVALPNAARIDGASIPPASRGPRGRRYAHRTGGDHP
jgi:membrane protein implicated in regulation of membrane protease activity